MKKIISLFIFLTLLTPLITRGETFINGPTNIIINRTGETTFLSWKNPDDLSFAKTILFRSSFPIESYFSFEAVNNLCDLIYEGKEESFIDTGLAVNLPYYYILFSRDINGNVSKAVVDGKESAPEGDIPEETPPGEISSGETQTLADASSERVNRVSLSEAGMVYNFNKPVESDENSKRLALFIIVKSPHDLEDKDKNAISYFIHSGTPTTILLGSGERAGVLNSYLSVFDKLPASELEWQDIIKIGNGRWPDERNKAWEEHAADTFFSAIYKRQANMENPNDSAAVTVIAYGLRPGKRNMESEKNAINIYRSIFGKSPLEAADWDIVRAIAYSGATR